jgi:hypothetical protein
MLRIKTNPVGIDVYIQNLQTRIHRELVSEFGFEGDGLEYECNGRCYRNKTENGYKAEVYKSGLDYEDVAWNDTKTVLSFFGQGNTVKRGLKAEAEVHFVMFANLQKLELKDKRGNVITHRADEELRQLVAGIIGRYSDGFSLISTDTGIEMVMREYPGSWQNSNLKYVDMHPVHAFRINLKLLFDPNKNCSTLSIK